MSEEADELESEFRTLYEKLYGLGVSQKTMASRCDVSAGHFSHVCNDKSDRRPTAEYIRKLEELLLETSAAIRDTLNEDEPMLPGHWSLISTCSKQAQIDDSIHKRIILEALRQLEGLQQLDDESEGVTLPDGIPGVVIAIKAGYLIMANESIPLKTRNRVLAHELRALADLLYPDEIPMPSTISHLHVDDAG